MLHYYPLRDAVVRTHEFAPRPAQPADAMDTVSFDYRTMNESVPRALVLLGSMSTYIRRKVLSTYCPSQ
jgi:hypothetical protein